jgi:hypothetical protein
MKVFAERSFCSACGARIAWLRDDEAEIHAWISRRRADRNHPGLRALGRPA